MEKALLGLLRLLWGLGSSAALSGLCHPNLPLAGGCSVDFQLAFTQGILTNVSGHSVSLANRSGTEYAALTGEEIEDQS